MNDQILWRMNLMPQTDREIIESLSIDIQSMSPLLCYLFKKYQEVIE